MLPVPCVSDLSLDRRVRYACLETSTQPEEGSARDLGREVHVPYFVNASTLQSPVQSAERLRDFGFVGTFCCGREWI
eukprot:4148161-Prymnesium_polylepis.1